MRGVRCVAGVAALTAVALVVGTGGASGQSEPETTTFSFTGDAQTFTVPAGVHAVQVQVSGAQGGAGSSCFIGGDEFCGVPGTGGNGAAVSGVLEVTPGETLTIVVGGAGGDAVPAEQPVPPGQLSEGGDGGFGAGIGGSGQPAGAIGSGGGGGGGSAILRGSSPLAVAGGGGGGGGSGAQEDLENRFLDGGVGGNSVEAGSAGESPCGGQGGTAGDAGGTGGAGGQDAPDCEVIDPGDDGGDAATGDGGDGGSGGGAVETTIAASGGGGGGGLVGGGGGGGGALSCLPGRWGWWRWRRRAASSRQAGS